MFKCKNIEFDEFVIAGILGLICALPLTGVLIFNGFAVLSSIIFGLLLGLFAGLALLSEEYKFLRIICGLIGFVMAALLSYHFSLPYLRAIPLVAFGALSGFFARKWIGFIYHAS